MDFGNFQDIHFVIFFAMAVIIFITLFVVSIVYIWVNRKDRAFNKQISYESTTNSIFVIDVQKNKMTFFNKSNMKNKEKADLQSFYNRFHPNDIEKVKQWILDICLNKPQTEEYLEADILINNGKKPCFSLLKLLKFNRETGLIYLENHILKYITPNNAPRNKSYKKIPVGIVKRSQILSLVNKNKSLRGYTFGIRFFYAKQKALSNNKIERHMIMTLKNVIYPFANNPRVPRQILDDGGNEMFLFDLKLNTPEGAHQLASSICHELRKQMEVNGFSGYISFVVGVVRNGQYYQDFDTILEYAREACISGQTHGQEITIHQRNLSVQNDMVQYSEQIEHILKDDVLRYLFRPIMDVRNGQVIGYFEYVRAYDSPFSSFQEMSKYAARINKNLDLFAIVAKHVISKYASENHDPNCALFLSISMMDIDNIVKVVNDIPASMKTDIIYVLEEQEVNENAANIELLEKALKQLVDQGFKIALLLHDKNLLLNDSVYHLFDYFIVGSSMLATIRKNNRIRLSTYTLIESLLKYNRPIIATDLESWQAVELIIESGINFVSSEVVAASNDMLLPLEKKKMEKIISMADKYL